jgi:hypothetical protein
MNIETLSLSGRKKRFNKEMTFWEGITLLLSKGLLNSVETLF